VTVSYAIMAHPRRRRFVARLQAQLGDVPVAWAEPPYAHTGYREPVWRTCREAMRLHTDAEFHCVIQDDALPCSDFVERVEALVERGEYIYQLFYRNKGSWPEVKKLAAPGVDFTYRGRLLGPAVVYPTRILPDLIAACDAMPRRLGSDDRIKVWAADHIDTYVPLPSLVDHRVGDSFLGHPVRRVAWKVHP
jgi:hypothetical protein